MPIFSGKRTRAKVVNRKSTIGFSLGYPEAEKESGNLFEDYFDLMSKIGSGTFIILGRKGVGKSAYVKEIERLTDNGDTGFCKVMKPANIDIEMLVQKVNDENVTSDVLFRWIILIEIVRLILKQHENTYSKTYLALDKFMNKNRDSIGINDFYISSQDLKKGLGISINILKPLLLASGNKELNLRLERAPFYQVIPQVEEIVKMALHEETLKELDFIIMFDDLDTKYRTANIEDRYALMSLIRVAKELNNSVFNGTNAKVLVFMRDDVSRKLDGISADKTKIFGSYSYKIKWYIHESDPMRDKGVNLREFINKRIADNFERKGIEYDNEDPWSTLVDNDSYDYGKKTAFEYVLDNTFYRPRDFINVFLTLGDHDYQYPLNKNAVDDLLREYRPQLVQELKDELSDELSRDDVEKVFVFLQKVVAENTPPVSYDVLIAAMENEGLKPEVFSIMVEHDLIVPKDKKGHQYYSYREDDIKRQYKDFQYSLPKVLYQYFH